MAKILGAEIEKKSHGSTSLTYPILAYDSFWVACLSLEKSVANKTTDIDHLKKIIITTATNHFGISGKIILNDAGDRINGNYDIWSVVKSEDSGEYIW
jgi:ABC-type branched-subunit amino acid transport system substrate-binding protein